MRLPWGIASASPQQKLFTFEGSKNGSQDISSKKCEETNTSTNLQRYSQAGRSARASLNSGEARREGSAGGPQGQA